MLQVHRMCTACCTARTLHTNPNPNPSPTPTPTPTLTPTLLQDAEVERRGLGAALAEAQAARAAMVAARQPGAAKTARASERVALAPQQFELAGLGGNAGGAGGGFAGGAANAQPRPVRGQSAGLRGAGARAPVGRG